MPNTLGGGRVFGVHFERKQNYVLNPAEPASASTKSLTYLPQLESQNRFFRGFSEPASLGAEWREAVKWRRARCFEATVP